jgi:hypothetical protein
MKEILNSLKYAKVEHLYVLFDRKIVHHEFGNIGNVEIDSSILAKYPNSIIIHNHPHGNTFSKQICKTYLIII